MCWLLDSINPVFDNEKRRLIRASLNVDQKVKVVTRSLVVHTLIAKTLLHIYVFNIGLYFISFKMHIKQNLEFPSITCYLN